MEYIYIYIKYGQREKKFYFIADVCINNAHVQETLLMNTTVIKFSLWEPLSVLIKNSCKSFPWKISPKSAARAHKEGEQCRAHVILTKLNLENTSVLWYPGFLDRNCVSDSERSLLPPYLLSCPVLSLGIEENSSV